MKRQDRMQVCALGTLGMMLLTACGPSAPELDMSIPMKDGQWIGKSNPDDQGAIGEVSITVEGGKITKTAYVTRQSQGTLKGQSYGTGHDGNISNRDYYQKAQDAIKSYQKYSDQLTQTLDPHKVDVVSGATIAHKQFLQAAIRAIESAQGRSGSKDDPANDVVIPGVEKDHSDIGSRINGGLDDPAS